VNFTHRRFLCQVPISDRMALIPGNQLRSHVGAGQVDDFLGEHGRTLHAALAARGDAQRAQLPPKKTTE
jgi:hypothetical protein